MTGRGALARRYAKALFGLGEEKGDVDAFLAELQELVEVVLDNDELKRVLFTPIHPRHERRGVIGELAQQLGLSVELRAFSMILVDENRTQALPEIRDALQQLVEQAAGRMRAQIRTARELSPEEAEKLRQSLARRVGAEVTLETEVDPSLIGGVVAMVGDLRIDGSVEAQLTSLAQSLRKG